MHRSGTPFTDASGDRLRDWMGVSPQEFYDDARVAIVPMGFCFPGQDAKGADLPPRRECSSLWHEQLFAALPQIELVLAVGSYAQRWHMAAPGNSLQETMLAWREHLDAAAPGVAATASLLAQQRLAQEESLVRTGFAAGSTWRGPEAA